jgi:hypothetical protein
MGEGALILHGVLDAAALDAPPSAALLPGVVPGAPLALLPAAGRAALVSRLPAGVASPFADPQAVTAIALAHHDALCRIAATHDVAPVALGAVFETEASLSAKLRERSDALDATLALIAGQAEYAVKLIAEPDAPAEPAAASGGAAYLRALALKRREDRDRALDRARFVIAFETAVAAHVRAVAKRRPAAGADRAVLSEIACLAPRAAGVLLAPLVVSLEAGARAAGLLLSVRGPWPPYSFATGG